MAETIEAHAGGLELTAVVELFELDASLYGGGIYRFTSSSGKDSTTPIMFGGDEYTPIDMEVSGFEWKGKGTLPTPTLRISTISQLLTSLVIEFNDLLGCEVRRLQTFAQFLDDGPEADSTQHFSVEVYRVERKASQNKVFVEFELSSIMDQQAKMLPGRQVIRESCTFIYRKYVPDDPGAAPDGFVYNLSVNGCPYAGTLSFDKNGSPCSKAEDACSKYLSTGCVKRYGMGPMPFRGFPGVARIRG